MHLHRLSASREPFSTTNAWKRYPNPFLKRLLAFSERPCHHLLQSPGTHSWRRCNTVPLKHCASSLSPLSVCVLPSQVGLDAPAERRLESPENVKEREGSMTKRKKKKEERERHRRNRGAGRVLKETCELSGPRTETSLWASVGVSAF